MSRESVPRRRGHFLGTNLTLGEGLRLVLLLCGPPWIFAAILMLTHLVPPPNGALGWIVTILAGPAAWGAFISAVADGRTLLGRPRGSDATRRRWWREIRVEERSVHTDVVGGDRIEGREVAVGGSAIARDGGVAAVGDGTTIIKDVQGDVKVVHGNLVEAPVGPQADAASLRQGYLNRILSQTQALQLAGVDPKTARDQTARTGLALAAVYTALMTQRPEQAPDPGSERTPGREIERASAVAMLNRERRLALLGDPGSGKTTFVNFVALCLAGEGMGREDANLALLVTPLPQDERRREEKPEPQPWDHGALLPVRVILRDFAARGLPPVGQRASGDHLWRFIAAELGGTLEEYKPYLKKELQERGGLILLDGLDEVPEAEDRRGQVKQAVQGFAADFPRCRLLVTSRTYAYQRQDWKLPGFAEAVLAPFSWGQIERFVDNWYAHLAAVRVQNREDAQGRAALLKTAIQRSDRLRALAERPLLLTLMASLHAWRGGNLPEKREELYADTVDLLLDQWESPKLVRDAEGKPTVLEPSLAEWLKTDRGAVRRLLDRLAYEAHKEQPELVGTADIPQERLVNGLVTLANNPDVKPVQVIAYVRDRAGLLAARGVGVYTFPHRTFQEYLAACYLTDHSYPDDLSALVLADGERWREVALLAGAKAARGTTSAAWNLAEALCCQDVAPGAAPARHLAALLAAQTLIENHALAQVSQRNAPKAECIRGWLLATVEQGALAPVDRAAAGDALAVMGDDRPGVGLTREGLPDIVWCDVSAGEFIMGSKEKAPAYYGNETPQHRLRLEAYRISKYAITNAQFAAFSRYGGYGERCYWREAEAAGRWRDGRVRLLAWTAPARGPEEKWFDRPADLAAPANVLNHPAVEVSWYEALAFCRWLSERLGRRVSLPSEAQWEKAARGTDGRGYPWGKKITPDHASYDEANIGSTSAVGIFPKGASPCGAMDMSGNVWEWTRSLWGDDWQKSTYNYPYDAADGRESLDAPDTMLRVLRGGAFYSRAEYVRCAVRYRSDPYYRYWYFGFRVVASPSR